MTGSTTAGTTAPSMTASSSSADPTRSDGNHDANDLVHLTFAVITVSDTRVAANDAGGKAIVELVTAAGHTVVAHLHVRDEKKLISAALDAAMGHGASIVVTTGGTGIAPRDVTYEVIDAMLEKRLDGFGEAFRRLSWDQVGARSVLSRTVAGTRSGVLIVALPGSERAVRLAVSELLLPIAAHAVGLLDRTSITP